jgi:murein DD-endopeptidase MepM/ murein hydrolase activator NlpD
MRWERWPSWLTRGAGDGNLDLLQTNLLHLALAAGLVLGVAPASAVGQTPSRSPLPASQAAAAAAPVPFDEEGDVFVPDVVVSGGLSAIDIDPDDPDDDGDSDSASDQPAGQDNAPPDVVLNHETLRSKTPRAGKSRRGKRAASRRDPAPAAASAVASGKKGVPAQPSPALGQRKIHDLTALTSSPVPGAESSGFGWRSDPINDRRKFHKGTDFRAPRGTPVYAAGGGVVVQAGRMGGYGNVIFIDHGNGVITRYGHLKKIAVDKDSVVVAGKQIGEVGSTGRATGPHLHFEVRLDGRAVNPTVAMSIAALQRKDPAAAQLAAVALSPEVQAASIDPHPRPSRKGRSGKRPDRVARAKRSQVLW